MSSGTAAHLQGNGKSKTLSTQGFNFMEKSLIYSTTVSDSEPQVRRDRDGRVSTRPSTCVAAVVTNQRALGPKGRPTEITGEALQVTVSS